MLANVLNVFDIQNVLQISHYGFKENRVFVRLVPTGKAMGI